MIFLMFLAGLDTDLKELKKTGLTSLFIAACGVVVPLIGGALCYKLFFPQATGDAMLRAVFVGIVLAATSVSITVETLQLWAEKMLLSGQIDKEAYEKRLKEISSNCT